MNSSPIPNTVPFAEEEVEIINRVLGLASPTQRNGSLARAESPRYMRAIFISLPTRI
jgi:hypothetical protein